MTKNPFDNNPMMSFSEVLEAEQRDVIVDREEPVLADAECFTLALSGGSQKIGWLGVNNKEWAVMVYDPLQALVLELYPHNGVNYYRIKGSKRYMSVSDAAYVGFYNWLNARGFTIQGSNLVSDYNHQKLSFYSKDNGYLYAHDKYTVLNVAFEPVVPPVIIGQPLTPLIEHVVVVMLENRSFDNMLGGLYPDKTKAGLYRGLTGNETNPCDPNDPGKGAVPVFQGPVDDATWIMPYPDPGELFDDMNEQIFGTKNPGTGAPETMQGFAWNYGQQESDPLVKDGPKVMPVPGNIMQYYSGDAVPMTWFLAEQFAVCDGWHAAGPVQTFANRVFTHCGTPGTVPGTNNSRLNNPDFTKDWSHVPPFEPPVHEKTIFQLLDESYPGQINWKVYYHDAPNAALCSYVYDHWKWLSWDGGNVFRFEEHDSSQTNFEYDIINNRLPKYSFIEPRYTDFFGGTVNSAHPGGAGIDFENANGDSLPPPISVYDGERFLAQVYNILNKYPETFKKTLLVVIYDEHGGLYDHVPPPPAVSPFDHPVNNFPYNRYGVRIPAMLVNPVIPPGTIYPPRDVSGEKTFDHTSLISTLCAQFALNGTLTPRSASAPKLENLIPLNPTVYPRPAPPVISGSAQKDSNDGPEIDVAQALAVIDQQKQPHSLAPALVRLLALEQQGRLKRRS